MELAATSDSHYLETGRRVAVHLRDCYLFYSIKFHITKGLHTPSVNKPMIAYFVFQWKNVLNDKNWELNICAIMLSL